MGEFEANRWIPAMVVIVVVMITLAVVMALLVTVESGAYVSKFDQSTVQLDGHTTTMTKFKGSTLCPYSGTWDTSDVGQTIDQCLETCLADETCRGFFHHNTLSSVGSQDACYFYRNNNAQEMVGSNVEMSAYFIDSALVFGDQLPGTSTDTYIKDGQSFKMFRSLFDKSVILQ